MTVYNTPIGLLKYIGYRLPGYYYPHRRLPLLGNSNPSPVKLSSLVSETFLEQTITILLIKETRSRPVTNRQSPSTLTAFVKTTTSHRKEQGPANGHSLGPWHGSFPRAQPRTEPSRRLSTRHGAQESSSHVRQDVTQSLPRCRCRNSPGTSLYDLGKGPPVHYHGCLLLSRVVVGLMTDPHNGTLYFSSLQRENQQCSKSPFYTFH